jgi:hypothetical protein
MCRICILLLVRGVSEMAVIVEVSFHACGDCTGGGGPYLKAFRDACGLEVRKQAAAKHTTQMLV